MAIPEWIKAHGILQSNQAKFLTAYIAVGMISRAAEIAEIDRQTHYDWMKNVPGYPAAFEQAKGYACDILEDEATRRAVFGVAKPVFYEGVECGTIQEYSDGLLTTLLKGNLGNKYREKVSAELTGKDGSPLTIQVITGVLPPEPKKPDADSNH